MTPFSCPVRNAEDLKVLFIGIICTILIFSFVTIGEGVLAEPTPLMVDLVQEK